MVVNFWMALGSTIYITANCCVLYYFRHPGCACMATLLYLMQRRVQHVAGAWRLSHAQQNHIHSCPAQGILSDCTRARI